jgi:two-component system cell cycle sensor histidine kinase/response regulator CckA
VAQEILETSERAASLTQQLLSFSRKTEFSPAWLNLADTVRRLEPILRRVVQRGRSLVVECNEEGGLVWIDPSQLEQVILNLVVNAHDAISEGGRIAVRTRRMIAEDGNTQAELEVSDTGSGIPPEVLEKIFEPFFTTKENGKGTGLGLAVVMSVARRWQGSVEVDSTVGVGTTFRVRLPLGDPRHGSSTAPA